MKLKLNREWSEWMQQYEQDHQDRQNAGATSWASRIAASFPIEVTIVGFLSDSSMFTAGWGFQCAGHAFEGKQPTFVPDKRALVAGLLWWTHDVGFELFERTPLVNASLALLRIEHKNLTSKLCIKLAHSRIPSTKFDHEPAQRCCVNVSAKTKVARTERMMVVSRHIRPSTLC